MLIRKARITDIVQIQRLINDYAHQGLMLPRSLSLLYESLRDFVVAEEEGKVVGTAGLHILWRDLAEIRGVAVEPGFTGRGIGKAMVENLRAEAAALGIPQVFVLTAQPDFFARLGFTTVTKESMPQKVWKDCINCPLFPDCNEVAMTRQTGSPNSTPPNLAF